MAKGRKNDYDGAEFVTALDPETGKTAQVTRKAFDSVYRDKGFELADETGGEDETPTRGRPRRVPGEAKRTDADTHIGGGAADIAKAIGVEGSDEGGSKKKDESGTDTKNRISDERPSRRKNSGGR